MVRVSEAAKEHTRERLLAAAARAFAERGLDGANINDISLAAGFAKGTVYNYFGSKQELFDVVLEHSFELVTARAAAVSASVTTRERLLAAVAADMAWARENDAFARVVVREAMSCEPDAYGRVATAAVPYVEQLAAILRDGQEWGDVRVDRDAGELALVLVGLGLVALAQHWGSGGGWPALGRIPDLVVEQFLEGVATRDRRQKPRRQGKVGT